MKNAKRFFSILLATLILLASGCGTADVSGSQTDETTDAVTEEPITDEPTPNAPTTDRVVEIPEGATVYNVIFALATIPPVLAALDCIDNGYETYAIIERGKTYNGIESLERFHNAGFDTATNLSNGFTETEFGAIVNKIKELNDGTENAFFNIYVQDGTALKGVGVAANAGLSEEQFHIYMIEDGTGAYNALYAAYVNGKTVSDTTDEIYDNYRSKAADAKHDYEAVMAKTDNKNDDRLFAYDIGKAFALASLPNFTYWLQNGGTVADILENTGNVKTKLLSAFGIDGYHDEVDCRLNLRFTSISDVISNLSETEREGYLTLMYGDYYQDTYAALTRTERAGEAAPKEKLVFIGSRHNGYPAFASGAEHGIGGMRLSEAVPATYAELDDKYKSELLFGTEADYNAFLAILNDSSNFGADDPEEGISRAKAACFNFYIDYMFTLKLTYALYGDDYDIIMKGHPRESLGDSAQWGDRYKVLYGDEQIYVFDKLFDNLLLGFHENDSVGKYIGMVPYGTAAENLAYLGIDITIAGLPSSTYSGYDPDVDVLFILASTNEDIVGTGAETAASQVRERYEKGNLTYTDKDGNEKVTEFLNVGNVYKAVRKLAQASNNSAVADHYETLFANWLTANRPGATDINGQGFAITAE